MKDTHEETVNKNQLLQLVCFKIQDEAFGMDILKVQEIIKLVEITKIPDSPEFVEGLINLRGKIIPVIDLRLRLGMNKKEYNNNTRIIVVDVNSKTTGFIVDEVNEVLRIPAEITEQPPELVSAVNSRYIKSIGKLDDRLLILLDFDKVLSRAEELELEDAAVS